MLEQLGLLTDNFYKFLTSLSLIAFIYCSSFDLIILAPHNKLMTDNNIETAKLASECGYLKGVSLDLTTIIKDSIKNGNIEYFYNSKKDTSELITYYSTLGLLRKQRKINCG